jgi:hypothetical protein
MISAWRAAWSGGAPGTTDPLAPFGLVTIHPVGCEGGSDIANLRHAQTANFGVLPNERMPNVFAAQGFDLADPWNNPASWVGNQGCDTAGKFNNGSFGPNCLPWDTNRWDAAMLPLAPYVYNSTVQMYMGGLHPRLKSPVGARLAQAYHNLVGGGSAAFTGPTVAGCTAAALTLPPGGSGSITVVFNATLLRGDTVGFDPTFDTNMTAWASDRQDSPGFMVCLLPANAPAGAVCEYTPRAPYWVAGRGAPAGGGGSLAVSFSNPSATAAATVSAIRYGWPLDDVDCCPQLPYAKGFTACPPAACPVKGVKSLLPANPFRAGFTAAGKCVCAPPQVCDM